MYLTRRFCVLSNTKLYHRKLLLWISTKFAFWMAKTIFFTSLKQYIILPVLPNYIFSLTLDFFSQKNPPICPNSHEKLTKIKIRSHLSRFETWSRITHPAHRKSYLVIICPNSHEGWPKSKLGQVGVGSNIAQNHLSST